MTNTTVNIAIHSEELFARYSTDEIEFIKNLTSLHNQSYASINFGADVIKDMIMSSIFGKSISFGIISIVIATWNLLLLIMCPLKIWLLSFCMVKNFQS